MHRRLATILLLAAAMLVGACASSGRAESAPAVAAGSTASSDTTSASGESRAATPALAKAAAMEDARAALARVIEARIAALAAELRPAIVALEDPDARRRFENARHLAASATLRHAETERNDAFLEPDGAYSGVATLAIDESDPSLHLSDELRRIARLEDRLSDAPAWRNLRDAAAARRREIASASPLPPIGASR